MRKIYFERLLRQDITWFDKNAKRDFSSRLVEDMLKIQDAISEKLGMLVSFIAMSIFLIGLSFWKGWKLTLALIAIMPVMILFTAYNSMISSKMTEKEQNAYAGAGSVAEEVFTNIRTVCAFNGQAKEIKRYDENILIAKKAGKLKFLLCGVGNGLMWFIYYANFAFAFWYGTHLVLDSRETGDGEYGPQDILVVCYF
jgi:ABC-type multidrug transport system fused ATPase/permease subunit